MDAVENQRRRYEAPELGATVGRMLSALVVRASEGDTEALEELAGAHRAANAALAAGLYAASSTARPVGYSYAELAEVIGTTRQNVAQRIGRGMDLHGARDLDGSARCAHVLCTGRRRCRHATKAATAGAVIVP